MTPAHPPRRRSNRRTALASHLVGSMVVASAVACAGAAPCPSQRPAEQRDPTALASGPDGKSVNPGEPGTDTARPARPTVTLASWNDTATRKAIERFVDDAVDPNAPGYIPPSQRIAVFDNDGTLWVEKPIYTQLAFALDRVRALAAEHPEWKKKAPFSHVLDSDPKALAKLTVKDLMTIVAATHAGMGDDEFQAMVTAWMARATHPTLEQPYTALTYGPMVELLEYLRAHDFKTYIVTGGGVSFVRVISESAYGVVPEQVIGTSFVHHYDAEKKVIVREREIFYVDDGPGKPIAIERIIGRRPVLAVGNSDGDFEMLEWTTQGEGPRMAIYVHHTDDQREFAYDRDSHVGKLDRGLTVARERGWLLIDMKNDWSSIFAWQE